MRTAFARGLGCCLPAELFPMLLPTELEQLLCGLPEVDVDVLKRVAVYAFCNAEDAHVRGLWEVLEDFGQVRGTPRRAACGREGTRGDGEGGGAQPTRVVFLKFVSAWSRLPTSVDRFAMPFVIRGCTGGAKEEPDKYLPASQTCFFTLLLPKVRARARGRAGGGGSAVCGSTRARRCCGGN